MAILKCKMCGGDIELSADKTFGTCDSCGSTMTFPKVDDEQRANMFNRGNHFRRTGEFDKALAVYERIVQEDENDAEAHWCCALCRFGIEYVEDPNTFEYLPTCHRASFDSFLEDVDYLAALEHSDGVTRRQYQKDAAKIAEVQRGILATSQNEEPFDVFICYKESENDGSRTRDSLLAQDIYYQLTEQGRRVFFSRITLEDKAGTEYEPYIFAALNSAKVMILVTTSAEHANAVWVKNEWSRFLSLMRKDRSKLLLPCYRDMDPYDLPEALSVLQSYDMSKIGFIQDLIRGVNKVLDASKRKTKETVKETVVVQQTQSNAAPLLKRAFMFLEDGDFTRADEFCEQVLNLDPENAEAYLGKLMAELKVNKRDALKDQPEPFDNRNNYKKAYRFGDNALKTKLKDDITFIRERNELARKEGIYRQAIEKRNNKRYQDAGELFGRISGFKDADKCKAECENEMETDRKNTIYDTAIALAQYDTIQRQQEAIGKLCQIPGWKDADAQIGLCEQRIETIKINTENARKDGIYQEAIALMNEDGTTLRGAVGVAKKSPIERHKAAIELLRSIPGWRDTDDRILACQRKIEEIREKEESDRLERERKAEEAQIAEEKAAKKRKRTIAIVIPIIVACIAFVIVLTTVIIPKQKQNKATALLYSGDYEAAYTLLEEIGNSDAIASSKYERAVALIGSGDYDTALLLLDGLNYKDSTDQIEKCYIGKYGEEKYNLIKNIKVGDTYTFGTYEQDNITSNGKEDIEWIVLDKNGFSILLITKYALDCQQYNTSKSDVTWETCSLRKWLNEMFLNAAFNSEEQNRIISSTVTVSKEPIYDTRPDNNTTDKVFILDIVEVEKYFNSDKARKCAPTDYAIAQGVITSNSDKTGGRATCWWWLRYAGYFHGTAAFVTDQGSFTGYHSVNDDTYAVLWINLE